VSWYKYAVASYISKGRWRSNISQYNVDQYFRTKKSRRRREGRGPAGSAWLAAGRQAGRPDETGFVLKYRSEILESRPLAGVI
jgi:hypothetical protein